jgi:hypothetical protein
MKNKTKVVVALGSLLAVTSGIGAYSTFAWFTTTRVATVNVSSATVYSDYGKLLVSYPHTGTTEQPASKVGSNDGSTTQPAQGTAYTFTQESTAVDGVYKVSGIDLSAITKNMTDISGSGKVGSFFKPTWIPGQEGTGASAIPSALNGTTLAGAASSDSYYTAFNLEFWNTGTSPIAIYFNSTTTLAAHTGDADTQLAKDNAAKSATRIAVYDGDTEKSVWQQETDANGYKYISAAAGSALGSFGTYTTLTAESGNFHVGAFAAVQKDFTASAGQTLISSLAAGTGKVLTFTMWIEGTATGATNAAIGGKVDLALNFAALEA